MSGNKYLVDTNIFIGLINGNQTIQSFLDYEWYYSFITRMELLSKPQLNNSEETDIRQLLSTSILIPYIETIELSATSLRRLYGVKLPDAFIAATALEESLTLLSFDSGFGKILPLTTVQLKY